MNWKVKLALLATVAIPAMSGAVVANFSAELISGVTLGWVGYALVVHMTIALLFGVEVWSITAAIASLISLPVVFGGALISFVVYLAGWGYPGGPADYSPHYISLCLNMLTVIPLAIAMVATLPVQQFESRLLIHPQGVRRWEKMALMCLRVFNHIVYTVIPNILEVMREERALERPKIQRAGWMRQFQVVMTYLCVEGICAAIQFIPLWAIEIASLPDRADGSKRRTGWQDRGRSDS